MLSFVNMTNKSKKTIGRVDKADFPELGLNEIAIKIDTGAYTSSIHCEDIHEENGVLYCNFLDKEHPDYDHKPLVFKEFNTIKVRSSNGIAQKRYEIKSTLKIFGKVYKISLSLSDRKEMKFPVLIGRKFLNGKFIVDPQLKDISFNVQEQ